MIFFSVYFDHAWLACFEGKRGVLADFGGYINPDSSVFFAFAD